MSNNATCANCRETIERKSYGGHWFHRNGFVLCYPMQSSPKPEPVATPIPKGNSRTSGTNRPTHLSRGPGLVTACGKLPHKAVEHINTTERTNQVTCIRCRQTVAYRNLQDVERKEAMSKTTHYVSGPNDSSACGAGRVTAPVGTSWTNAPELVTCSFCKASSAYVEVTNSRTSGSNPVPTISTKTLDELAGPPARSTNDPVQAALMKAHPDLCCAIYGDTNDDKAYCPQPRDHAGSCTVLNNAPEPKPTPQRRPVYCVHCQQYHSPDDQHRVSFDYPPIPYARELFESRQADLRGEMQEYIEGRLSREELAGAIERIETEYVQGMHDLFILRLI